MEEIGLGRGTLIEISRRKRLHQSGVPLLDLTGREKRSRIALWWTYEADFLPGRAGLVAIIRRVPQFAALSQLKATNPASLGGTFGGTYCLLILKILKINILFVRCESLTANQVICFVIHTGKIQEIGIREPLRLPRSQRTGRSGQSVRGLAARSQQG